MTFEVNLGRLKTTRFLPGPVPVVAWIIVVHHLGWTPGATAWK